MRMWEWISFHGSIKFTLRYSSRTWEGPFCAPDSNITLILKIGQHHTVFISYNSQHASLGMFLNKPLIWRHITLGMFLRMLLAHPPQKRVHLKMLSFVLFFLFCYMLKNAYQTILILESHAHSNTSYPLSSKNYSIQVNFALKKFAKKLKFY